MPTTPVQCDTVDVTFIYQHQDIASHTMPAYTRSPSDLARVIAAHAAAYLDISAQSGDGVSLGDFVMYLTVQAAGEPFEIE